MLLDLGVQPLANNLLTPADRAKPEPRFPLRLALCEACWLVQITDIVPPVELFSEYLYFSSVSDAMLRHAAEAAGERPDIGATINRFVLNLPGAHVRQLALHLSLRRRLQAACCLCDAEVEQARHAIGSDQPRTVN